MTFISVQAQEDNPHYMEALRANLERHGVTETKIMPTLGAVFGYYSGNPNDLSRIENVARVDCEATRQRIPAPPVPRR